MLFIVLAILSYGWALYGFSDLVEFYSSTTVHWFLESWWFRDFLRGWLILGETTIFVTFYASNWFGYFCVMDGHFMDFVILWNSISLPQFMDFQSLGGLGVSSRVDLIWGKLLFLLHFMLPIFLDFFLLCISTLYILSSFWITWHCHGA